MQLPHGVSKGVSQVAETAPLASMLATAGVLLLLASGIFAFAPKAVLEPFRRLVDYVTRCPVKAAIAATLLILNQHQRYDARRRAGGELASRLNGRDARCPSERARCPFSQSVLACRGRRRLAAAHLAGRASASRGDEPCLRAGGAPPVRRRHVPLRPIGPVMEYRWFETGGA